MGTTAVKYELVPYEGRDPMFEAGCVICDKRTCFDIYDGHEGHHYGLIESVCSEECFNLWLMQYV